MLLRLLTLCLLLWPITASAQQKKVWNPGIWEKEIAQFEAGDKKRQRDADERDRDQPDTEYDKERRQSDRGGVLVLVHRPIISQIRRAGARSQPPRQTWSECLHFRRPRLITRGKRLAFRQFGRYDVFI